MRKKLFVVVVVVIIFLGFGLGFFLFAPDIKASDIGWGDSPNEDPTPVYDEVWRADRICYVTADGYRCVGNLVADPDDMDGVIAGRIIMPEPPNLESPYVEYHPKARVTKWKVRGHIHFP